MSEAAVNRLRTRILHLHWLQGSTREEIGDVHRATQIGQRDAVRYNPSKDKTWISGIVPIFGAAFPDLQPAEKRLRGRTKHLLVAMQGFHR